MTEIKTNLKLDDLLNELRYILNHRPKNMWKGTIDDHYKTRFITSKERDILYDEFVHKMDQLETKKALVFYGKTLRTEIYHEDSYDFIRNKVDGYIERVALRDLEERDIDMWVNEEGKLKGLETTALLFYDGKLYDKIVGTIVFTKHKDEDTISLTDDDIKFIKNKFDSNGFYLDLNNDRIIQVLNY